MTNCSGSACAQNFFVEKIIGKQSMFIPDVQNNSLDCFEKDIAEHMKMNKWECRGHRCITLPLTGHNTVNTIILARAFGIPVGQRSDGRLTTT